MPLTVPMTLAVLVCGATACRGANRLPAATDDGGIEPIAPAADAPPSALPAAANADPPAPKRSGKSRCADVAPRGRPSAAMFEAARPLRSAAELTALMDESKRGEPRRIALQAGGTYNAGCECPPFGLYYTAPGEGFQWLDVVPRPGASSTFISRAPLDYVLLGYFSGEEIDWYEHFRAVGVAPGKPDEEERLTWLEVLPEFCVESWCYAVPPRRTGDDEAARSHARFLDDWSAQSAASLAKSGVPRCERGWIEHAAP